MVKPRFIEKIESFGQSPDQTFGKIILNPSICSKSTVDKVKKMMFNVVDKKWGTAHNIKDKDLSLAGKTGTSQVKRITEEERELDLELSQIPYRNRDHAWFIAFGPYKNPRYAMSILVEHGGSGSKAAAPLAKKLMKAVVDRHQERINNKTMVI